MARQSKNGTRTRLNPAAEPEFRPKTERGRQYM